MKQITFHILLCLSALLLPTACSDDFLPQSQGDTGKADDGIGFSLSVVEQADRFYQLGRQTRAASLQPDSNLVEANTFVSRPFTGDMAGLQVHRMPLPIVGIHPHTATGCEVSGATRAKLTDIVDDKAINFHDSLTIWGYTDKGRPLFDQILLTKINGWRSSVHWPYDLQATTVGDVVTDAQVNPAAMRFYAIAPALEGVDVQVANTPAPAYGQPPVFTYTVPDNPVAQRDLLYGQSADVDIQAGPTTPDPATLYPGADTEKQEHLGLDDKVVALQFSHILTAVRFAQGKMPVGSTVKLIELYHIKNKGTYTPGTGWAVDDGTTATYDLNVSHTVGTWDRSGENTYIDGGNVLFLMPHTLTSAAELHVTLTDDGGTDHTVSCKLTGDEWLPGYTVTYKITVGDLKGDYYLLVEPSAAYETSAATTAPTHGQSTSAAAYTQGGKSFDHSEGGAGSFTIHSFRNYKDYSEGTALGVNMHKHEVPWKITGFSTLADATNTEADGSTLAYTAEKPSWLTLSDSYWNSIESKGVEVSPSSTIDAGSTVTDGSTISYTMDAQEASFTGNHAAILADNGVGLDRTGDDRLDLSAKRPTGNGADNVSQTTANCYIVNSPDKFEFPAVYGNAIENGITKTYAGGTLNSGDICLDHAGRVIKFARIIDQVNYDETTTDNTYVDLDNPGRIKKVTEHVSYNESDADLRAQLVWKDSEQNVISGIGITGSKATGSNYSVQFQINTYSYGGTNLLPPANAVIAFQGKKTTWTTYQIYKSDGETAVGDPVTTVAKSTSSDWETLWTWHIWVTDEVYPNNQVTDDKYPSYSTYTNSKITQLKNTSGSDIGKILPVNLGWVPDAMTWSIYAPREVWICIEQTESADGTPQKAYLKLRREARQDLSTGTSTIYQWGRPTALPPKLYIDGTTPTTILDASSVNITASLAAASGIATPAEAIAHPTQMATGWAPTAAYWSATQKTLYDPCPPGYQMPTGTLFAPFSLSGATNANDATHNYLNMWPTEGADSKGGYFYTTAHTALPGSSSAERYSPKVYVPATGTWSDSYVQGSTATGYLWTGTSGTSVQVRPNSGADGFIRFDATSLGNGYALPVRPVKSE